LPELATPSRSHGLVDILDRVLDKGLVVAGDIKINLANVELLTIQIRLVVCSIDKAEQVGLNWWRSDPRFSASPLALSGAKETEERLRSIEKQLQRLTTDSEPRRKGGGK
jgi:hypothetical protein